MNDRGVKTDCLLLAQKVSWKLVDDVRCELTILRLYGSA